MDPKFTILAQLAPGGAAETPLYTVTATEHIIANEIVVCNRSGVAASFRISVSLLGGATAIKDYFYFDLPISGNDTFGNDMNVTLGPADVIRVYASSGNLTFTLIGAKT